MKVIATYYGARTNTYKNGKQDLLIVGKIGSNDLEMEVDNVDDLTRLRDIIQWHIDNPNMMGKK